MKKEDKEGREDEGVYIGGHEDGTRRGRKHHFPMYKSNPHESSERL